MAEEIPGLLNIAEEFVSGPARRHPQRIAILGEPRPLTYGQVDESVRRAGNALRASGCRPGDRVLLVLPDSIEFIAAFFGAARIGAIPVPVNSMARASDYSYYLADSGARFAIVHESVLGGFKLEDLPEGLCFVAIAGKGSESFGASTRGAVEKRGAQKLPRIQVRSWSKEIEGASANGPAHRTRATDAAFFLYTSGSGGIPKAAVHRHADMVHASRGYAQGVLGLRADDVTYSVSKLFFAYGLGNGMYFPFSVGASTVLDPGKPKPERTAEIMAKFHPTVLFSVPTFFAALLREVERGLIVNCSSLRLAVSAGEPLPAEIFERFRARFGVEILDGIGSTEMLHIFLSSRPGCARPGSSGTEVPGCEAKIVDERGLEVAPGEMGSLWAKGGGAFAGYWNKAELSAETRRGPWVVTGDKFTRDADGFFRYCGRTDDMMKVSGMWVSPVEVENALLGHPLVEEAAVAAQADAVGLLHPAAYVVLKNGAVGNAELLAEVQEWLRQRLAPYKCPREVHFVDNLPKTATGKIQRFLLRKPSA